MAPSGVEQVDAPDGLEGVVEYAVYGARGELPELGGLDAVAGAGRVEVHADEVPDDWTERWKRFYFPVLIGGRLYVRPPWEEPAHRGGVEEVVIDPGRRVRDGHASYDPDVPRAASGGRRAGIVLRPRLRLGSAGDRGVEAGLRTGARRGRGPGGTRRDPAQRARQRRRVEVRHVDLRREEAPVVGAVAANLTAGLCEAVARSWASRGVRPGQRSSRDSCVGGGGGAASWAAWGAHALRGGLLCWDNRRVPSLAGEIRAAILTDCTQAPSTAGGGHRGGSARMVGH